MMEKRFSAAARTYDRHAQPQQRLAKALIALLPDCTPDRILELGCGTGQLTRCLSERFPATPIDAVDSAEKMIQESRRRFNDQAHIKWLVGDARTYRDAQPYPLIVSSAALHWIDDLQEAFDNIHAGLREDGFFALGIMLQGTLGELHQVRQEISPDKAPARNLPSNEAVMEAMLRAGFSIQQAHRQQQRATYRDAASFLRALHEQGVTGGFLSRGARPLNRSELQRLVETYQARHETAEGVFATYETATFLLTR